MSSTRQIQDSLEINNSTASGITAVKPANSMAGIKQDSSYKYIKIVINDNELLSVFDDDNGDLCHVMNARIELHNEEQKESPFTPFIRLHELNHETSKLFASVNEQYKVDIFFSKNNVTTRLPEPMCSNLVNLLKIYKPVLNPNYCCINFVYEMQYGRGSFPSDDSPTYFYYYQSPANDFSEDMLSCADVVRLFDASYDNDHYAIYLGENYYISKFGNVGPLLISTLDQAKQSYHSTQVARISLFSNYGPNSSADASGLTPNGCFRQDPIAKSATNN